MLYLRDDGRSVLPWIVAAFALYLVVVVITMAVHVPLNDDIKAAGNPERIADLAAVRDAFHETRWVAWNIVRAQATTVAFGCLTWALVLHGRTTSTALAAPRDAEVPATTSSGTPEPPASLTVRMSPVDLTSRSPSPRRPAPFGTASRPTRPSATLNRSPSTRHAGRNAMNNDTSASSTDQQSVRALYQQFMDAWNQGDGAAVASMLTDDGDLVGFDGTHPAAVQ